MLGNEAMALALRRLQLDKSEVEAAGLRLRVGQDARHIARERILHARAVGGSHLLIPVRAIRKDERDIG